MEGGTREDAGARGGQRRGLPTCAESARTRGVVCCTVGTTGATYCAYGVEAVVEMGAATATGITAFVGEGMTSPKVRDGVIVGAPPICRWPARQHAKTSRVTARHARDTQGARGRLATGARRRGGNGWERRTMSFEAKRAQAAECGNEEHEEHCHGH